MFSHLRPGRLPGALMVTLLIAGAINAQNRQSSGLPAPRLYVVTPAGAKAGTTVEVTVAGFHLEDAGQLVFSDPRIKAEVVPHVPEVDPKTKKRRPGKKVPTSAKFKVTVPATTPLGNHDVRVVNKWGVSNPRVFQVGDLPEVAEVEPNNDIDVGPNKAQRIEVGTTINAYLGNAVDVDYYVFKAAKGQRVVVSCLASTIDSRAQPSIEVIDAAGKTLSENTFYRGDDALCDIIAPEAGDYHIRVTQFTHTFRTSITGGMPAGSSDQQYRLTVSSAPWIDAVLPCVIEPGKTVAATVWGRNLPGGKLDPSTAVDGLVLEKATVNITAPADGKGKLTFSGRAMPASGLIDGFEFRLKNAAGSSNPFLVGIAHSPVILDVPSNDTPEAAQAVSVPCEVAGAIKKRRDRDWYKFSVKKGETWSFQVLSNRLGAPTYMALALYQEVPPAKGAKPGNTRRDIHESPLTDNMAAYSQRFFARSEDPQTYRYTAPADADLLLLVSSRAGDTLYGPRHAYAVRIAREQPDFRLAALGEDAYVPSVTTVPKGGSQAFHVVIDRKGGFAEEVELSVEGLPAGVTCPPQILAGTITETTLVVTATAGAADWAGQVKVKGTTTVDGKKVTHEARAASIVWPVQANGNIPTITRMDSGLWLAVRGKPTFTLAPSIDKPTLLPGDKATVKVKLTRIDPAAKAAVLVSTMQGQGRQGSELPRNLRLGNQVSINAGKADGSFAVTVGADVPPGSYNVVFRGQTNVPFNKDPKGKSKPNTVAVGISTPLTITVLPKTLATLSVNNTNPTIKAGATQELTVRVVRKYGFAGEFKVSLVIPAAAKGVEAAQAVIPAGSNEAKLMLKTQAGAKPGGRRDLLVRAVAVWNGKTPVTHDVKININVTK